MRGEEPATTPAIEKTHWRQREAFCRSRSASLIESGSIDSLTVREAAFSFESGKD